MVQLIHNALRQTVRIYIADFDKAYDLTCILTNLETKEQTTQQASSLSVNSRAVKFDISTIDHPVGMYTMDLFQPSVDLGRHLVYLRFDADSPIEERPYNTYSTNPSSDVVYDG
jgi:hypothetical protein